MVLQALQVDVLVPNSVIGLIRDDGTELPVLVVPPGTGTAAPAVTFTPSTPASWPLPVPTNVQEALDAISKINAQQLQNAAPIGPLATVTFTSPGVASVKSGVFLVVGTLAANCSGVSTQAGVLQLDGATIASSISGTGGAGPFDMSLVAIVTVVRGTTHTFGVSATASAGTNTIPAALAKIVVVELP